MKILAASQASDPPKAPDRAPRGQRASRNQGRTQACPRRCHLPTLGHGELRMWGPHLITSHGTEGFRCITCARVANHKRARYALKGLPCADRARLAGPLQPHRPRAKWSRASETRWRLQGEGGHQVVRYNSTQHDGRYICVRCGLHCVRYYDLRIKQCTGVPANQAATKAIADALKGGRPDPQEGGCTPSLSTRSDPARGPPEPASPATDWCSTPGSRGRPGRRTPRPKGRAQAVPEGAAQEGGVPCVRQAGDLLDPAQEPAPPGPIGRAGACPRRGRSRGPG